MQIMLNVPNIWHSEFEWGFLSWLLICSYNFQNVLNILAIIIIDVDFAIQWILLVLALFLKQLWDLILFICLPGCWNKPGTKKWWCFCRNDLFIISSEYTVAFHGIAAAKTGTLKPSLILVALPRNLANCSIIFQFFMQETNSYTYFTEKEIEDLCKSCGLVNYSSTVRRAFIIFSAQKP